MSLALGVVAQAVLLGVVLTVLYLVLIGIAELLRH